MQHTNIIKVYLEDTDAQGIVYHANYLKFFERSRTDIIDQGKTGLAAAQDQGFRFVVHEMKLKFSRPAKLGELLTITTEMKRSSAFRLTFTQLCKRDDAILTRADVEVVCIGRNGDLVEIPESLL